jgi:hypothetical protein
MKPEPGGTNQPGRKKEIAVAVQPDVDMSNMRQQAPPTGKSANDLGTDRREKRNDMSRPGNTPTRKD